jgi:hypothetical protein
MNLRMRILKPLLMTIMLAMCLVPENIGDKLDAIAIFIYIHAILTMA